MDVIRGTDTGAPHLPKLTRLESVLRERARELIREHALPGNAPARVWGGRGDGSPCALCGEVIPASELEYEIESEAGTPLHLHFMCHAAWQLECVRAAPGKTKDPSPGMVPATTTAEPTPDAATIPLVRRSAANERD